MPEPVQSQPEPTPLISAELTPKPAALPSHIGLRHFSAVEFFIVLVLIFIATPFVEHFQNGDFIEGALMTVVLTAGVLALGGRRRTLLLALLLALPAVIGKWVNQYRSELVPPEFYLASGLLFVLFVIINFLRYILLSPRVNAEVMCAGISVYLLLGGVWAVSYIMVFRADPGSFSFTTQVPEARTLVSYNAAYFSYITLSTVGYGDIVPVSKLARMLAMAEAMTGTIYLAVFISRLVALYSSAGFRAEANKHSTP